MTALIGNPLLLTSAPAAGGDAYQIEKSLRFNELNSPELRRFTFGSGNRRKFTLSWWQKETQYQKDNDVWTGGNTSGHGVILRGNYDPSGSDPTGTLFIGEYNSSWDWYIWSKRAFRDVGAWQHYCVTFDSTEATNSDRVKLYINGQRENEWNVNSWPDQHHEFAWNSANNPVGLGGFWNNAFGVHFDGYIADAYHLDGIAVGPCAFGKYSSLKVWEPKALALPAPNDGTTWSSNLYTSDSTYNGSATNTNFNSSPNTATAAFDGSSSTYAQNNEGSPYANWTYFRPTGGITGVDTLRVWTQYVSNIRINGVWSSVSPGQTGHNSGAWYEIPTREIPDTLTEIAIQGSTHSGNASSGRFGTVEINGVYLVDGQIDTKDFSNPNNGTQWSESRTGDNNWNNGDTTPARVFDGSMVSSAGNPVEAAAGNNFTFTFGGGISDVETLDINLKITGSIGTDADCKVNGTSIFNAAKTAVGDNVAGWYRVPSATHGGNLNSLYGGRDSGAGNVKFYGIKVNGIELIDNHVDNSFHLKFNDTKSEGRSSIGNRKVANANGALPILNTTDDFGEVKGSGNRTDSDASDLYLAITGDTVADVSNSINSSSTTKTVTASGGPVLTTTKKETKFYGKALKFASGFDQNIIVTHNTELNLGSGNFTLEGWVYPQSTGNYFGCSWAASSSASDRQWLAQIGGSNSYNARWMIRDTGGTSHYVDTAANTVPLNQWTHLAFVRNGNEMAVYCNGIKSITDDYTGVTINDPGTNWCFGANLDGYPSAEFDGYMNDIRFYKKAKYTSNFKPILRNDFKVNSLNGYDGRNALSDATGGLPILATTDTYGAVKGSGYRADSHKANLVFAMTGEGSIADVSHVSDLRNSGSAKTITKDGSNAITTHTSMYYGSSISFDGQSDIMYVDGGSDFEFGTGDFTIEFWVNVTGSEAANYPGFLNMGPSSDGLESGSTNAIAMFMYGTAGKIYANDNSLTGFKAHDWDSGWHHWALCKTGGYSRLYVDGKVILSTADTKNYATRYLAIGTYYNTSYEFKGNMQDLRIYKGVAKYTTEFTVSGNAQPGYNIDGLTDTPTSSGVDGEDTGGVVTGNYCTLNPLDHADGAGSTTFKEGNLYVEAGNSSSHWHKGRATFTIPKGDTGKWYYEAEIIDNAGSGSGIDMNVGFENPFHHTLAAGGMGDNAGSWAYKDDGNKRHGGSTSSYGSWWTDRDIIGVGYNNGSIFFWRNGTIQNSGTAAWTSVNADLCPAYTIYAETNYKGKVRFNFGQRPFKYPQTGYKGYCTQHLGNLFDSETSENKPSSYFNVIQFTGTGQNEGNQKVVTGSFSPDLVWTRPLISSSWAWYDRVRGTNSKLYTDSTGAPNTNSDAGPSAWHADGLTLDDSGDNTVYNGTTGILYAWDAGTATSTSNNASGSNNATIACDYLVNPTSGFSIAKYTGTDDGTGTNNIKYVYHGLNTAPDFVIIKKLTSGNWIVKHKDHSSTKNQFLDDTHAETQWGSGYIGDLGGTNANNIVPLHQKDSYDPTNIMADSTVYMMYSFTSVPGFSQFGTYSGNSSDDGSFVYTGFSVNFVMIKRKDSTSPWTIFDNERGRNENNFVLEADTTSAQDTPTNRQVDLLSNGFKNRATSSNTNDSSATYIYAAFAEHPFKLARAV